MFSCRQCGTATTNGIPTHQPDISNVPDDRLAAHVQEIAERAEKVTGDVAAAEALVEMANQRLDVWERKTGLLPDLSYAKRTKDDVALLWKPEAGEWNMWTCPNSLRDTEAQANLQIVEADPTYEHGSQPPITLGHVHAQNRPTTTEDIDETEDADTSLCGRCGVSRSGSTYQSRRVGSVRPSQMIHTYGPGAVMDLPQLSVVLSGIDGWDINHMERIIEPRLIPSVRTMPGCHQVDEFRMPPWQEEHPAHMTHGQL